MLRNGPQRRALRIEEIAQRSGTPKRFLEHILLEIRNAGFMASARGRNGGYALIKEPKDISLSDVLRLIDGPIAPLPCLSCRAYQRCDDCPDEAICRLRKVLGEVFWCYLLLLESLTLRICWKARRSFRRWGRARSDPKGALGDKTAPSEREHDRLRFGWL